MDWRGEDQGRDQRIYQGCCCCCCWLVEEEEEEERGGAEAGEKVRVKRIPAKNAVAVVVKVKVKVLSEGDGRGGRNFI